MRLYLRRRKGKTGVTPATGTFLFKVMHVGITASKAQLGSNLDQGTIHNAPRFSSIHILNCVYILSFCMLSALVKQPSCGFSFAVSVVSSCNALPFVQLLELIRGP
jgi:hypothetical protein